MAYGESNSVCKEEYLSACAEDSDGLNRSLSPIRLRLNADKLGWC